MSVFNPLYISIRSYKHSLQEYPAEIKQTTFIALAHHKKEEITKGLGEEQVSKIRTLALERELEIRKGVSRLNEYSKFNKKYNDYKKAWKETSPEYEQLQLDEAQASDTYAKINSFPLPPFILNPPGLAKRVGAFVYEQQPLNQAKNLLIHISCTTEFTEIYTKLGDGMPRNFPAMTILPTLLVEDEDKFKEKITFCISKFDSSVDELKDYFYKFGFSRFVPLLEKCYPISKNKADELKNNSQMESEIKALVADYGKLWENLNKSYNDYKNVQTPIRTTKNELKETLRRISKFCLSKEILEHDLITDESKSRFTRIIDSPKF